eukprot:TRINITY_DN22966_c0_g1_i1.p1 TRINITY_DN22966_c0_g1~~TRINITY_DN22966_c0_g1_i1.p1  ORF type:complete len:650 (+),score=92.23 TRINITY_DN22966_c0_g1_i1:182-2131(+)
MIWSLCIICWPFLLLGALTLPFSAEADIVCQGTQIKQLVPNVVQAEIIPFSGMSAVKCFEFNDTNLADDISLELTVSSGGGVAYVRQASLVSNDWTLMAFNGSTDWLVVRSGDKKRVGGPLLVILFGTTNGLNRLQLRLFQSPHSSNVTTDPAVMAAFKELKSRCCKLDGCSESWWKTTDPDPCLFPGNFCDGDPRQLKQLTLNTVFSCELPLDILTRFSTLEMLEMRNNDLSITAQVNWTALVSLRNLKYLDLFGNNIGGNVSCVLKSSNLTYINLMQNRFGGEWPSCLLSKDDLSVLRLGYNSFSSGELRDNDVSLTSQLVWLNLRGLGLVGQIPPKLGTLKSLALIDLGFNKLTGTIPPQFNKSGIAHFLVESNLLEGPFPDFVQMMPEVQTLALDDNNFGGALPDSITNLPNLQSLHCQNCRLSGPMPETWSEASNLQVFQLSMNNLTGSLPKSLFSMKQLSVLDISMNSFTGPLPEVIVGSQLYYFNVSHNGFSGPIPDSFQNMPLASLYLLVIQNTIIFSSLDLSYNQLSGPLPPFMNSSSTALFALQGNDGLTCKGPSIGGLSCSPSEVSQMDSVSSRGSKNTVALVAAVTSAVIMGIALLAVLAIALFKWKARRKLTSTSFKRFRSETATPSEAGPDPSPL